MAKEQKSNRGLARIAIIIIVLSILSVLVGLYTEWLWFDSLNYGQIFTTIIFNKVGLYLLIFVVTFIIFYINLNLTRRHHAQKDERPAETEEGREIIYLEEERTPWRSFMQGRNSTLVFLGISLLAALILSSAAADKWIVVQQYFNRVTTGIIDPIFNKNLSFYFFNLSFYHFIYDTLMSLLLLLTVAVVVVYLIDASLEVFFGEWNQFSFAKGHVALLITAILGLKAWGYKLAAYDILFSSSGLVYGATYSDIYGRLLAYKVLMAVSLLVALIVLANLFIKRLSWILISLGAWLVLAVVLNGFYPAILQKLVVQPNEFNKEKPYIENAIKFTRQAYALDKAETRHFNIDYSLDITSARNQDTVQNIRLWDWEPLRTTYKNLQELRPYYVFEDVDIDRYNIEGRYRQVMLSAREIDQDGLPATARTWINEKLMYTHGYGIVASPVTEVAEEGFPQYYIKDIPPRFSADLKVTRPEIYFGEVANSYVFVNTAQKEFNYPLGDKNVYSFYKGKNGIKIDSFGRRLLLAWALKDYKMLLSSDLNNSSQVLMFRNITKRAQKIAPYLSYDGDPYIVISPEGRLFWMLDAYTVTDKYPYSQPFDDYGNNYLRNAVKITCDAYTGEMNFYIADNSDPIIKSYEKIFPGFFHPLSGMPEGLRSHIRYPEDMYKVQTDIYKTYHMTDPYVFYNKEDPWLTPVEVVGKDRKEVEPYYIVTRLPGSDKSEYVLMLPFTPKNRPNMIAWMCARMDGNNYGKLLVYDFPKQETIYGPEQVEARINQNTEISQQLSLWDQRGSRVYRGNLLVIPMDNSILYIEPLYLQAENSRLPELKRVIAGFGNEIVMETTLDRALQRLFQSGAPITAKQGKLNVPEGVEAGTETVNELIKMARQYYDQANQRLKAGDWSGYGENISKLDDVIRRLEEAR